MATASITASAPRPPVASSTASTVGPSSATAPEATARARRPATGSTASTRPAPWSSAARTAHRPDRAEAEHHDRAARRDVGARRAGPAGAEVVGEQQRGLVVDAVGDGEQLEVRGRHGEQLGLAAAELARAEHLAGPARRSPGRRSRSRRTPAAGDGRDQHPVTDRDAAYVRPASTTVPTTSWPTATGKNGRSPS